MPFPSSTWSRGRPRSGDAWPRMAETHLLTLDSTLARSTLGWSWRWDWKAAVSHSLEWYVAVAGGEDPADLTRRHLAAYAVAG
jgi:hypothetical protein